MNKNFLLIGITAVIIIFAVIFLYSQQPSPVQQLPSIGGNTLQTDQNIMLTGTVEEQGKIGVFDCQGFYILTDDTGTIQLSNDDFENFLGKKVEVVGKFKTALCQALTCTCVDSIIVETIKIIE